MPEVLSLVRSLNGVHGVPAISDVHLCLSQGRTASLIVDAGCQLIIPIDSSEQAEAAAGKVALETSCIGLTQWIIVIFFAGDVVVRVEVAPLLLGLDPPCPILATESELRVLVTHEASLHTAQSAFLMVPDCHRSEDWTSCPLVLL